MNQLRQLFSNDYTDDHREYRPASDINMRLRFSQLHRCRGGRISKSRKYGEKSYQSIIASKQSAIDIFEGPASAFFNYVDNATPSLRMHLSSLTSPESRYVNSARLMLDGSTVPAGTNDIVNGHTTGMSFDIVIPQIGVDY